jgi:hypothetical protein
LHAKGIANTLTSAALLTLPQAKRAAGLPIFDLDKRMKEINAKLSGPNQRLVLYLLMKFSLTSTLSLSFSTLLASGFQGE